MKVRIDTDICIGCGLCAQTCPDIFKMDESGKAIVHVKVVSEELEIAAREAVDECPVTAIFIE